ncbi:MAG: arsenite efflux transporter metallochaperone ArsD [Acidobacteria bacterium]|nr:arsenite efflux transporter metallochaperone ArsD [Acidobacteriota bacterium]
MTRIDVFDPPMCCSSGVCGPEVDPLLAAFAADVDWLTSQGVSVTRHNLAQEPQAFVTNPLVQQALQRDGDACLPLVLVNGEIVGRGTYPRRDELARLSGLTPSASRTKPLVRVSSGGCCTPGSGCC